MVFCHWKRDYPERLSREIIQALQHCSRESQVPAYLFSANPWHSLTFEYITQIIWVSFLVYHHIIFPLWLSVPVSKFPFLKGHHACMLSCFGRVQLSATLWTIALQAPLSMVFSRQEYWSGLLCPPPRDLPNPGIEPRSLTSPVLAGGFFTTSTIWGTQSYRIRAHPVISF